MNLVSKEFVAARDDEHGVLVLSTFAGAARELSDALMVNPYDIDAAATALLNAIAMPVDERRERLRRMRPDANRDHASTRAQLSSCDRFRCFCFLKGRFDLSACTPPV